MNDIDIWSGTINLLVIFGIVMALAITMFTRRNKSIRNSERRLHNNPPRETDLADLERQAKPDPVVPVGQIKSFGPVGPKYEVGNPLHQLDDGDWMIEVTLVESGEIAEYRLSHILKDPKGL